MCKFNITLHTNTNNQHINRKCLKNSLKQDPFISLEINPCSRNVIQIICITDLGKLFFGAMGFETITIIRLNSCVISSIFNLWLLDICFMGGPEFPIVSLFFLLEYKTQCFTNPYKYTMWITQECKGYSLYW